MQLESGYWKCKYSKFRFIYLFSLFPINIVFLGKYKINNIMLNNEKLVKYLRERWNITPYRIALETGIPHASLKYMLDEKFEWKLNHLLSYIDFLNRYNAKISLTDLLDFDSKQSFSEIMKDEKADFRDVKLRKREDYKNFIESKVKTSQKGQENKPLDSKTESEVLAKDINDVIKESHLYKGHKISIELKITDKKFDFRKELKFADGKKLKA
jgi:hypothetical protein